MVIITKIIKVTFLKHVFILIMNYWLFLINNKFFISYVNVRISKKLNLYYRIFLNKKIKELCYKNCESIQFLPVY